MNRISKRLLGLAGGAAALALVAGMTPASASTVSLTLNPAGTNGSAGVAPDSTAGTFSADGGLGWAFLGVNLDFGAGSNNNNTGYSAYGIVNIDSFTNPVMADLTKKTGLGTDGGNWVFFATVHVVGEGSWNGGNTFTATSSHLQLDLWAAKNGISSTNFGNQDLGDSFSSLGQSGFGTMGIESPALSCYTGSEAGPNNCLLLATADTTGGSHLTIEENGQANDSIGFTLNTMFDIQPYALGSASDGGHFFQPPDTSPFGLLVISGCKEGEQHQVDTTNKFQGDTNPVLYKTSSNQSGNATCHNDTGIEQSHDPVNWVFTGPTTVPEPASLAILGSALLGFGLIRRRRRS